MYTLFISTYDFIITIGLLKNNKKISIKEVKSVKSHSVFLIPTIESILKGNNLEINNLNEIIVINGPGSFTGVRLGVIVAKTLAYTLKINIKTITSIDALAISNNILKRTIVSINDNKGVYFAIYESNSRISDIKYLSKNDFDNKHINESIINNGVLDVEKITLFLKDIDTINPHNVKPIYVKEIEVLK
ncbi:MAG: tRNA (adenosine(37)-N6)-threonylcarbamoyltransferase complex dimerization subunit type 1 TsaB [Bacilli bacterium]|nr:tRNA (adenosine(37)-N6)-threonylcarbamoyltransferase complex dimerization subunit type 1 TsaB [Bacilli bacterium]MDD4406900.1 tRNA (adenosine(37)-N6)-threonylcarbamoyltransferase complex dimerization subunit type 1 TsaB [Bacilli bacterium]